MIHVRLLCLLFAAAFLTGCHSRMEESGAATVSLFQEGKGVWFSDETKKLFGLEITEVSEKPVEGRVEKTAQVYREGASADAILLLTRDETKGMNPGQRVMLRSDAGEQTLGTLARLDSQTEAALGQIEAIVEFSDPNRRFPIGSFLTATVTNGETRSVFVVSQSAVLAAADGDYVYTVNGSHLTRTRIKTGAVYDGLVEVEEGLYSGDSIASKGVDNLWLVELSALKGGTPCCAVPKK